MFYSELDISEGKASLLGILASIRLIWRYDLECLGQSSKHIIVSKPLSLNLSAIDIPIKGNVNDNNKDKEEWDDNIKVYQLISTVKEINFDNLLRF